MNITIKICTDNDAFQPCARDETIRILSDIIENIKDYGIPKYAGLYLKDYNGNHVGDVTVD